ncbi:energy-coupling factor ABC transporter permease [Cellulomonas sp. S1-8]|uniref:energy-coupling factor ABC transporter permease n=1 Tax=Cellulomonas sp. S1-8 TaxID=2904790 RepID=UPI002244EFDC|nr:energy-coupling factor ABC transporter permease [Cellulomonas sp. S1-8]UZN04093.1 energy-coupling factor ABC transporter permease [Cellulomonas sp. S1-8]
MHVPDQYLTDPVSVTTAAIAGAVVVGAALRARHDATLAPHPALIGATTAAVFGLQMLNYPVGAGTSGHLMGGALAAALLGPVWGLLSVTLVLVVQAVAFADGGLTALGTNTLLMAVVGTLVGWAVARGVVGVARRRAADAPDVRAVGPVAAAAGGAAGVVAAAALFVALYAVGGTVGVPLGTLTAQMLGVHALIGLGEAVITGAVVAVVVAIRPAALALTARDGTAVPDGAPGHAGVPLRAGALRPAGVLAGVAGVAAVVLSSFASSAPDGLEATAARAGFAGAARDHALAGMPLADYGEAGGVLLGVAGGLGVVACAVLATGLVAALTRSRAVAVEA